MDDNNNNNNDGRGISLFDFMLIIGILATVGFILTAITAAGN